MTILIWLFVGLAAGIGASTMSRQRERWLPIDIAVGLVASLVAGVAFLLLR